MPIEVVCSTCQGVFNAPDTAAGKRAKCPTCGGVIQIPTAVAEEFVRAVPDGSAVADSQYGAAAPNSTPEDRKRCPMCGELIAAKAIKCRFCGEVFDPTMRLMIASASDFSEPGWDKVRSGLQTLYYCMAIIIAAAILLAIGAVTIEAMNAAQQNQNADPPIALMILIGIGGLVILGAYIGWIVGQVLCTNAPERSGARGFAVGAVVCTVIQILIGMISVATQNEAVSGLGNVVSMVGTILFILFIRRIALYLNDQRLATSAGYFLAFGIAMIVGVVVMIVVAAIAANEIILGLVGLALLTALIISVIWFLMLIRSSIRLIDSRTAAG